MVNVTQLSLELIQSYSIKTIVLLDTSTYSDNMTISGNTLLVKTPGNRNTIELSYNQSGVTILNSSNLGITRGIITDLPDGIYTAKITICPYDIYWYEKQWYRTEQLECKYARALLELDINNCRQCFSAQKVRKITKARVYIDGIGANVVDLNFKAATECYNVASKMLDELINCNCKENESQRC